MSISDRILVSTLVPKSGGVPAMAHLATRYLRDKGLEPVIAYYEPFSYTPDLSVPSYRLLTRPIGRERRQAFNGYEAHAVGAWLPELEFTHYVASKPWRELIDSCTYHIAVSGTVHAAVPLMQAGKHYFAWVATAWEGDRRGRVERFSPLRRALEVANAPVMRNLERRALRNGRILALSGYTRKELDKVAGGGVTDDILSMPVDTELFHPRLDRVVEGRVGFTGRLGDGRKNVRLLLEAFARLGREFATASLHLVGAETDGELSTQVKQLGIGDRVTVLPYLSKEELTQHLQTLDVYVVPSHQEGLCIAALEAMACGCPVVSTRCGGPEDYVTPGKTGELVDFDVADMANAISGILTDRGYRNRLGEAARQLIEERYNERAARAVFWANFEAAFST